jgi:hypothetical protein
VRPSSVARVLPVQGVLTSCFSLRHELDFPPAELGGAQQAADGRSPTAASASASGAPTEAWVRPLRTAPAAYLDGARGSLPTKPPTAAPTVASRRGGPSAVNLRHVNVHAGVSCQHKWISVTHFESSWTLLRPIWTLVRPEQCLGIGMTHFLSSWTGMTQAHKFEDR